MTNDINPFGDEQAKAVQRIASFGEVVVQAGEKLAAYVGRIVGTMPEDAVGVVIGDPLRFVRTVIAAKYDELLSEILRQRGVAKTQPVSPSVAIPLLRAAYDESRSELQEVWARLLANAMDPKRGTVRLSFIEAVKKFDPLDALVLRCMSQNQQTANVRSVVAQTLKLSPDEIEVSLMNLREARCVDWAHTENPFLTALGRELLRALE